jgi:hypothetical protein
MSDYDKMAKSVRKGFGNDRDNAEPQGEEADQAAAFDAEFAPKKQSKLKQYMKKQGQPMPDTTPPEQVEPMQGDIPPSPMPQAVPPSPTPDPHMVQEQAMRQQAMPAYMEGAAPQGELMQHQQNHEASAKQKALGMYLRKRMGGQ